VAGELAAINTLKRRFTPLPAPDLDFVAPADGRLSGRFGARRVFNGRPRAPHVGLDFAVPRGTPIVSAGAGTVLATADYFFNGKTVFVDHGQGLISMYCHLDQIEVAAGQPLQRGERLGRAGSTGRASGPHLHWSVILNGAMVDPELLLPEQR
jgi:murein DD-endopeptidase MepM/ murein hydrolase activator NlpD